MYDGTIVWFDGIQLVKDEFGESYTYDSDRNVVSVQDLRNKNSTYKYASNDLTKAILPNGAELKYTYDDYHNVKESTSGEGIRSQFTYDSKGNNTSVKILKTVIMIMLFHENPADGYVSLHVIKML